MPSDLEALKHELSQSDLFLDWDGLLLELVASICQERDYKRGQIVFDENSDSEEMYIVAEGEVEIRVRPTLLNIQDQSSRQTIATVRRGQNFGEIALIDQGRRTAAAVASQNATRLIVIPYDKMTVMCENVPRLGYLLMRNLAADLAMKIRRADLEISAQMTWQPSPH